MGFLCENRVKLLSLISVDEFKIINESWFLSNGYIDSTSSIDLLEQKYIKYNLPILKQFKHIAVATTYSHLSDSLVQEKSFLWKKYFPDCHIIDIEKIAVMVLESLIAKMH